MVWWCLSLVTWHIRVVHDRVSSLDTFNSLSNSALQLSTANVSNDWPLDDLGSMQTLFRVQVGWGFVDQVHISWLAKTQGQGHTLQFTSWQILNLQTEAAMNSLTFRKESNTGESCSFKRMHACTYSAWLHIPPPFLIDPCYFPRSLFQNGSSPLFTNAVLSLCSFKTFFNSSL